MTIGFCCTSCFASAHAPPSLLIKMQIVKMAKRKINSLILMTHLSEGRATTQLPALELQLLLVMFLSRTEHLVPSGYSSVAEPVFVADDTFPDTLRLFR